MKWRGISLQLQNHQYRKHRRFWWIVAMPKRANQRGKYFQCIGRLFTNKNNVHDREIRLNVRRAIDYLATGAKPSTRVQWILAQYGLLPPPLVLDEEFRTTKKKVKEPKSEEKGKRKEAMKRRNSNRKGYLENSLECDERSLIYEKIDPPYQFLKERIVQIGYENQEIKKVLLAEQHDQLKRLEELKGEQGNDDRARLEELRQKLAHIQAMGHFNPFVHGPIIREINLLAPRVWAFEAEKVTKGYQTRQEAARQSVKQMFNNLNQSTEQFYLKQRLIDRSQASLLYEQLMSEHSKQKGEKARVLESVPELNQLFEPGYQRTLRAAGLQFDSSQVIHALRLQGRFQKSTRQNMLFDKLVKEEENQKAQASALREALLQKETRQQLTAFLCGNDYIRQKKIQQELAKELPLSKFNETLAQRTAKLEAQIEAKVGQLKEKSQGLSIELNGKLERYRIRKSESERLKNELMAEREQLATSQAETEGESELDVKTDRVYLLLKRLYQNYLKENNPEATLAIDLLSEDEHGNWQKLFGKPQSDEGRPTQPLNGLPNPTASNLEAELPLHERVSLLKQEQERAKDQFLESVFQGEQLVTEYSLNECFKARELLGENSEGKYLEKVKLALQLGKTVYIQSRRPIIPQPDVSSHYPEEYFDVPSFVSPVRRFNRAFIPGRVTQELTRK